MMAHIFNTLRDPKVPARRPEDFLQKPQAEREMTGKDMRRQVMSLHAALTGKEPKRR